VVGKFECIVVGKVECIVVGKFECIVVGKVECIVVGKAKMHQFPSIGSKCVYLILTVHSSIYKHTRLLVFHTNPRQLS
jgi:mannose-6-phosphate isomerase-like protein (cupin superfamily)